MVGGAAKELKKALESLLGELEEDGGREKIS
jgi:hypothetical protein